MPKPPSPQSSSAPTTGTTTTPTSVENAPPSDRGHGLNYPRDQLPQTGDSSWMPSMYDGTQQTDPSDAYAEQQGQRYNPANYPTALKLLVSNNVAGSIIGRGGQTISELQMQSSTRIKLSQTGDYYPGTQDRVCLVQGEPDNVKSALRLVLERLYMLQEHQHSQHMAWQLQKQKGGVAPAFDFVVRLLVPSSSCGMIIGKSGQNIKFMEETTGVSSVRLSPKDSNDGGFPSASIIAATSERVVTVTGASLAGCVQCLHLIVDGMMAHPEIFRYANMTTSYSRIVPDAFVAANTSRQILVPMTSPRHSAPDHHLWDSIQGLQAASPYGNMAGPPARRIASSPDLANIMMSHQRGIVSEPRTPDRLSGYATGLGGGGPFPSSLHMPPSPSPGLQQPLYLIPQQQRAVDSPSVSDLGPFGSSGVQGVHHSMSAPDLLAFQMDQSMHLSSPPLPPPSTIPVHHHSSSQAPLQPPPPPQPLQGSPTEFSEGLLPQVPQMTGPGCFSAQVYVPDTMIGSILGRGGRALTELQMLSGTRIRISQRGEYMPGTRARIVNIRGPTAQCVWQAQYMMSQRMVLPPTAVSSPGSPSSYASPPRSHGLEHSSSAVSATVTSSSNSGSSTPEASSQRQSSSSAATPAPSTASS